MIQHMIPHSGAMCLLDNIVSWDKMNIHCISNTHLQADNPLRFNDALSTLAGLEYVGQAIAAHRYLLSNDSLTPPKQGYLAALKNIVINKQYLSCLSTLEILAKCIFHDVNKAYYEFSIQIKSEVFATGNMIVFEKK